MKITHNGKRYDTRKMELIAESTAYHNGNYAGDNQLWRASDGTLFAAVTSNGQDCYRTDDIWLAGPDNSIDNYKMTDAQETRASELGLIEIIP